MAEDLVEDDTGGDGSIEGASGRGPHGNAGDEITTLTNESTESVAFGANNESTRAGKIEIAKSAISFGVETGDPQASVTSLVEGAPQITDTTDRYPVDRTGGSFGNRCGEADAPTSRQDSGIDAESVGRPQNGTQIVGVLQVVEKQQE